MGIHARLAFTIKGNELSEAVVLGMGSGELGVCRARTLHAKGVGGAWIGRWVGMGGKEDIWSLK